MTAGEFMKNYKTFAEIRKEDISQFEGLEKELVTHVVPGSDILPFEVTTFGITFPDKKYHIKREPTRCFVFEYIVEGKGYVINNNNLYTVEQNDVYIIHPGDYCEYFSDKDKPYKKYWINFKSELFYDIMKRYGIHDRTVFKNIDLKEDFERIFEHDSSPCINDDIYIPISNIVFSMFMKIAENNREEKRVSTLAREMKYELTNAINLQFNLDDLYEIFHINKSQLIREFKKHYGVTPYQYLMNIRIEFSKTLLADTEYTIKQIANMLAFSNAYNFSNYFKQHVGMSPKQFRLSQNP